MIILNKVFKNKKFILFIFFLIILFLHQFMNFSNDDVSYFSSVLNNMSIIDFIVYRYNAWSSRIIIEVFLAVVSRNIFLWRVLDSLVIVLLIFSIDKLFNVSFKKNGYLIVMLLFFMYPFINMSEAGFCATTMNYLWPLTFMLFGFIPFKNMIYQEKNNKLLYPFYVLGLVYACNQEQSVCIVFVVALAFLVYGLNKKIKIWYPLLILGISLVSLIFILTCPGNAVRKVAEIATWYPNYIDANFLDKFYLAVASTISIMLSNGFVLLLFSYVLSKRASVRGKLFDKVISNLIFLMLLVLNILNLYGKFFDKRYLIFNYITYEAHPFQLSFQCLLFLGLGLGLFFSFLYLIYRLFDKDKYWCILVLLLGLGTRVMMGFTPTIFASGARPLIFLYFSLILLMVYWFRRYDGLFSKRSLVIVTVLAIFSFLRFFGILFLV